MDDLNEIRGECLQSVFEATDNIMKYSEGDERNQQIKQLQSVVKKYCILEYQTQVCEEALENVVEGVEVMALNSVDEKFVSILKNLVSRRPNVNNHSAMLEFLNKINIPNEDLNESDIVETQSSQAFIDPITKKKIVNPVKNKICGHLYEKSSIQAMLKKKATVRCPVIGCANRNYIAQQDLVIDEELRIKLSQIENDTLGEDSD